MDYNAGTGLHEITYDEEEENCFFNLTQDISQGDLISERAKRASSVPVHVN